MLYTFNIIVSGKVQGVFYRQSTKEKAHELDIKGTVQNLPDGNVAIVATGTADQVDQLIAWCKSGPEKAIVDRVMVSEVPLQLFKSFKVVKPS